MIKKSIIPLGKAFIGILVKEEKLNMTLSLIKKNISPIDFKSEIIPFDFTDYYTKEMGPSLLRIWVSLRGVIPQDKLLNLKKLSINVENMKRKEGRRIFNLDPGIVTESKVALATTKDYSHRIYLGDGVYGEVTLIYRKGEGYLPLPWTYPDYRTETAKKFFLIVRKLLREEKKKNEKINLGL